MDFVWTESLRVASLFGPPTPRALLIYGLYLLWLLLLSHLIPATRVQGQPLKDGSRLTYPINGTVPSPLL